MGSSEPMVSKDSPSTGTRNCRAKPLHTVGASILNIAHKVYTKAESCRGPIGYATRSLAKIISPIVYTMQYQWLAMLSYTDEQMLAMENLAETIFPSTAYAFDKIDELVHTAAILLAKFENAVDQYPDVIHWKHFLSNMLDNNDFAGGKENEVMGDFECTGLDNALLPESKEEAQLHDEVSQTENEIEHTWPNSVQMVSSHSGAENVEVATKDEGVEEDPILELFDEGWYMR